MGTPPKGEDRLRAGLLHLAAEAHRRKWAYSRAEDDRRPNPAFDELHRIGNELRALLDTTPGARSGCAATGGRSRGR